MSLDPARFMKKAMSIASLQNCVDANALHPGFEDQNADIVRKLCKEAIGPLAPSLAWVCSRRMLAAHLLCMTAVGLYAILLPILSPRWLEENIAAEATRVGSDLAKQKGVFRVSITVLSVLNFMCMATIALARKAIKSVAINNLVLETWKDKQAHAHIVGVFRQSYEMSAWMLALVIAIYAAISSLSGLPNKLLFLFAWSPAFLPVWVVLQLVAFVRLMAALSLFEVEAYYSELEATGSGCAEAQDFMTHVTEGHWLRLLRRHQELIQSLKNVSRAISSTVLFFQNVVAGASLLLLWVARASQHDAMSASGYVLLAFIVLCSGIVAMLPLASITDLCQSRRLGRRSLLYLADKYSGWPMTAPVHAEYMRFMQHLNTREAGMFVPTMGLVTRSSLCQKIMFYVKVLPLALAVTMGWWRRG
eukprot:TRINITY_DN109798_c0_g1_i1.p1 TRINITY_DN109798_c0_g1~~TRINITY_DN109798_c0_g1_i1.p1  ORF type:complete len:419 (-),score=61.45 TRINITY_DN109798_c0_g1_i1:89-1345(-)